jgi:hypothetical protein
VAGYAILASAGDPSRPGRWPAAGSEEALRAGAGDPAVHTVRNSGVEIICHALELAQPPADLLDQIRDLAARLATAGTPASVRYPIG